MSEEDQDKNNVNKKEDEVTGEENQLKGESSPNDTQPSESSASPPTFLFIGFGWLRPNAGSKRAC